ncbi:DUF948 domain-containing protein [Clostridium paridis]|uniref:DUF948 domain-containing protein n=1 Tax=Clostridium paridis TaxID=2803863 RepID=A0A937FFF2_9CLOT|nr:DUF948 domain-containing protein [Clostridium paridis]MBL4932198.1 DUF948 domain-containing protein [Clostridium paridis]
MLIDIRYLFWGIIAIAFFIAIIYLIFVLRKLVQVLSNVNSILESNKGSMTNIIKNMADITDNVKDVSEVVTETTADVIVAKENISEYINIFKDILFLIKNVFKK